jgi:hypothetical protein
VDGFLVDHDTLAGLALLAVLAQYPANHRVASASRVMESTRRAAGHRYRALFRRLHRDRMPLTPRGAILDQLFRSGQVRDNIDSFTARATEAEQAALVSRISSSLLLGGACSASTSFRVSEAGRSSRCARRRSASPCPTSCPCASSPRA